MTAGLPWGGVLWAVPSPALWHRLPHRFRCITRLTPPHTTGHNHPPEPVPQPKGRQPRRVTLQEPPPDPRNSPKPLTTPHNPLLLPPLLIYQRTRANSTVTQSSAKGQPPFMAQRNPAPDTALSPGPYPDLESHLPRHFCEKGRAVCRPI